MLPYATGAMGSLARPLHSVGGMSENAGESRASDALELSDLGLDDILDAAGLQAPVRNGTRERIDAALARAHQSEQPSSSGGFGDLDALELDESAPEVSFGERDGKPFRYSAPPIPGFEDTDGHAAVDPEAASYVDPHAQTMAEPSPLELDTDSPLPGRMRTATGDAPTLLLDRPDGVIDLLERGMARRGYTPHAPRAVTSAGTPVVVGREEGAPGLAPPPSLDDSGDLASGAVEALQLDHPSEPVLDAIVVDDDDSELPLDAEVIEAPVEAAQPPDPAAGPRESKATHYLADLPEGVAARVRREAASPTPRASRKRVIHDDDARVLGRARVAPRVFDGAKEERNTAMERERERSLEALLRAYVDGPAAPAAASSDGARTAEILRPHRRRLDKKR